jgi:RimJ/RimL family protein N-acetyltransferase
MAVDRAEHGQEREARERRNAVRTFQKPEGLTIGFARDKTPVGSVALTVVDQIAIIGEVGVVPGYRGNGYGLDLLCDGAQARAAAGAGQIVADTDRSNASMRAIFAQAGWFANCANTAVAQSAECRLEV